jgi:hypothetical protein
LPVTRLVEIRNCITWASTRTDAGRRRSRRHFMLIDRVTSPGAVTLLNTLTQLPAEAVIPSTLLVGSPSESK